MNPVQSNPVHNPQLSFFQIIFNDILSYKQLNTTPKCALPFGVSLITVEEFLNYHACSMSYQYLPSRVFLTNNVL
jgi:hypothetical protein